MDIRCMFGIHRYRHHISSVVSVHTVRIYKQCMRCDDIDDIQVVPDDPAARSMVSELNDALEEAEQAFKKARRSWLNLLQVVIGAFWFLYLGVRMLTGCIISVFIKHHLIDWVGIVFYLALTIYWCLNYNYYLNKIERECPRFDPPEEEDRISADEFYTMLQSKPKWYDAIKRWYYDLRQRRQAADRVRV